MPHPYHGEIRVVPRATQSVSPTCPSSSRAIDTSAAPRLGSRDEASPRLGWHEYFLGIARAAAARSDCTRSQVGAVLVQGHRVRSTGYNGAPSGMAGCGTCPRSTSVVSPLDGGYDTPGAAGQCVAVHAEVNAVLYAERADVVGSTVYVTREPCAACTKTCRAAGVSFIVWPAPAKGLRLPEDSSIVLQDLRATC